MPHARQYAGWFAAVVLVIVLLPAFYMGSYYALVQRGSSAFTGTYFAMYRVEGVHSFFRPAHWVDRRVRSNYWE